MSIYMMSTLEIKTGGVEKFSKAMSEMALPFLEKQGWRLNGAYMQTTGRLNTIIDLWELDDMNHYHRVLMMLMSEDFFPAFSAVLEETVLKETIVFSVKAPFAR